MSTDQMSTKSGETKIVRTTAAFDCGGRCHLRLHVEDGVITRLESDDADEPLQLRACLRCRALRQFIYHPERLKYPLKRVGKRGSDEFERISWDEAYDTIIEKLNYVKDKYGSSSILLSGGGGYQGSLHNGGPALARLLSLIGGYGAVYGNISSEGAVWAVMAHYGDVYVGNSRQDLMNSKLIIMWGWDPARMISGTGTLYHVVKAKEAGAKIISIDPRYQDSAAMLADQWIPIKPGTDTAVMVAMAYVMIKENLQDQAFLDKYTVGFDKFKDYVLGKEDGVEKTPQWASEISTVPTSTIVDLAREYAATVPTALVDCQGPARSAMGEQYTRCAMTLCAMTGNVGKPGGSAGGGLMVIPMGHLFRSPGIPGIKNPAEAGGKSVRGTLDINDRLIKRYHANKVFDSILKGKAGGAPFDTKFAWFSGCNLLNQRGNTNKAARALKTLEFIVTSELFMTPTARHSDIVLPVTSVAERSDIVRPWPSGDYYPFINQAIEPLHECKSDLVIATELAERMGFKDFNTKTDDEWLRLFVEHSPEMSAHIKDFDKFKEDGVHRVELPEPVVAFRAQIEDPENNPFNTPSGKIEIFSQRVADIGNPKLPPIPKYLRTPEDQFDELAAKYPLQLMTPHAKNRVHSGMYLVEWLREVEPHQAWINPVDAEARGIKTGDKIHVFNDRGKLAIEALATERMTPGVISIFQGAWYDPDENGIDQGGCANTLTNDEFSPGGAAVLNTSLVEIEKV